MAEEFVKAKLDVVFKKLFTSNEDMLKSFLEAVLDMPKGAITHIDMLNTTKLPVYVDGKLSEMDLLMHVGDKVVNVEIQIKDEGNYPERSVFYWSKAYTDELEKGKNYLDLKQTICINILNFKLFDCDETSSTFKILETTRYEVLTDKFTIMFFELVKVNDVIEPNNLKKLWLQLINAETKEELDMLNESGVPEIEKAVLTLHEMSKDEELREIIRVRERTMRDIDTAVKSAEIRGMDKGMEKGREKERTSMIAAMRKMGMTEQQIQTAIELAQEIQ